MTEATILFLKSAGLISKKEETGIKVIAPFISAQKEREFTRFLEQRKKEKDEEKDILDRLESYIKE